MRSPIEGESFSGFIKEVLGSFNFDWYVKLGYDPARCQPVSESRKLWESIWAVTDPDGHGGWTKTPPTAWHCFDQWIDEIQIGRPHGPGVRDYLWLEERQFPGQVIFHVLIADWNGFSDTWEFRWKEISNGWAKTRELDERTGGLLSYLVMKAGCVLELNCGGIWGRYSDKDFKPWNPTRY